MSSYSYTPNEVSFVLGLIETHMRHKEMTGPPRGYEMYHPSAMGKCLRLMQYQRYEERGLIQGDHESFGGRMLRLFENGHNMHSRWARYFETLGVLRGVWVCENPMCRLVDDEGKLRGDLASTDYQKAMGATDIIAEFYALPECDRKTRVYGKDELQGCFKPAKCTCGHTKFRYDEVDVHDDELNFHGHADMLLDFRNFDASRFDNEIQKGLQIFFDMKKMPTGIIVVDMKTVGSNSYKNTVMKSGPHKYYLIQLQTYINVLKCDSGLLIYEEKDAFELAAFKVDQNPEQWDKIKWQASEMNRMAAGEKPQLPPPRPISKSSYDCKGCAFKKYCHRAGGIWDDPQLEQKREEFYGITL